MKRILYLLLALLLVASLMTSCAKEIYEQGSDSSENMGNESFQDTQNESSLNDKGNSNGSSTKDTEKSTTAEKKPLTKFEKQFSVKNEERLASILAAKIKTDALVEGTNIPTVSTAYSQKKPSGDGGFTYIYNNASATLYNTWCDKLSQSGYAQYTETEFNGTKYQGTAKLRNMFTTFVSTLAQADIEYHEAAKRMYVTFTPRKASVLPQREAPTTSTKQTNFPILWTYYGLEDIDDYESSLGYIIRITDGSFIVIDGGEWFPEDSKSNAVVKRMYDIMKKQSPDPNNIVISAWIITHAHNDHAGAFWTFQREYGSLTSIKLKQIVHNFPDKSLLNTNDYNYQCDVIEVAGKFSNKTETLKPHTGNVLYYPGIKLNILYTQENYLAVGTDFRGEYNASSLVIQFVTDDGTKLLVGADHPVSGSYQGTPWCEGALYNWYGSFIESDVVSTFHHGYGGGADSTVYYVIKAKTVLLNCDKSREIASNISGMTHNRYFGDMTNRPSGVKYYMTEDSVVGVITFSNGNPTVKIYDTINEYLNS